MEDDVDFIDCEGRGVGNELFVKVLSDDRGFAMRECVSGTGEDKSLLPLRLAIGVDRT